MTFEMGRDTSPVSDSLDSSRVTFVYTMFHHLGDFVVMAGLLRKFDLLLVEFESVVAHKNSAYVSLFCGKIEDRFFDIATIGGLFNLVRKLRKQKKSGKIIFGLPMAPGSIQAYFFFWFLKKLGALTYIVDFNLINADVLTPPKRRYIFDRHLAQAAEIMKRPEWLNDTGMPLGIIGNTNKKNRTIPRVGFYPESARAWLPEFRWPDTNWIELAGMILQNPDCEISLIGRDKTFGELAQAFRSSLPEERRNRFSSLPCSSVEELLKAIESLDFLVTVNTSALHLAHALKVPLIALCGSSAEIWLPEGDHIRIIQDMTGALPPSDKYWHDPLQPSLQRIKVLDVYDAFVDIFKRFSTGT
jgi:ADP-heptose:LPS heptosyltransferase